MIFEMTFDKMIWYSIQFLGDFSMFVLTTPVYWIAILLLMFTIVKVAKLVVS